MRIDGENGWVEILLRDDEEAFDVRCAVGDLGVSDFLCNLIQAGKRSPNMREKWASAWRQKIGGFQCTFAC